MSEPVEAVVSCGGAARWATLRDLGVSRGRLAAAVSAGHVRRVRQGLFVVDPCPPQALAAAAVGGVLSCATALVDHGVPLLGARPSVHLTAPRGSRRAWHGCLVHRRERFHDGRRVDLAASLVDAAICLPLPEAVAAVDAVVGSGRLAVEDLPFQRWWPAARDLVDARAQSVLESVVRVELVVRGIGPVRPQVFVDRVGYVDLLVREWLVVETDGFTFHSSRASYAEDRRRDDELARRGYVVLRFTYDDVVHRRPWLVQVVREVLDRGRPPFWSPAHAVA